jgi:uncharacterized membrane protein YbhN (UPF0104 family)
MKSKLDYVWPFIGLAAVIFSIYLLSKELRDVHVGDIWQAIASRGAFAFLLCVLSTLVAYAALAWYDRIALMHVGKRLSWPVVSVVSFVAYALGHNVGASVVSSGAVRYRAYSRMGLSVGEVAVVTAFCAFTFAYGSIFLGGIVLVGEPGLVSRLFALPKEIAFTIGLIMLALVLLYQLGSLFEFRPLVIRSLHVGYPKPSVAFRQLFAAPIEIIGAAAIIYFALPELGNPGFFVVLGVFLASFCAGLISNAPGGIGVFEATFITAMPDMPKAEVLAALIVFRLLYLLIPLALSCVVILLTERRSLSEAVSLVAGKVASEKNVLPSGQPDRPGE